MTAVTYDGNTPAVGADADTWGAELNTGLTQIKADLEMLNASPTARILGRTTTGTGEVERLTAVQTTAMLSAVVGDSGSGGTKGLVPAPAAGDAAAGKVLTAAGTWGLANVIKAWGLFTGSTGATVAASGVSCVRNSESLFTFTLSPALASANYALFVQPASASGAIYQPTITSKTSSGFAIQVVGDVGGSLGGLDPAQINVAVISA